MATPKPYGVGFMTGTFDIMHRGHYAALKYAKTMCERLIVGLTTDERATKRKRAPVLLWETRYEQLINCVHVDEVVVDTGQEKALMQAELHFDALFTVDEYRGTPEYVNFTKACPDVPVHYFPRLSGLSSSALTTRIAQNTLDNLEYLAVGVNGKLMHLSTPKGRVVIKEVQMGLTEYFDPLKTSNVYRLPFPNLPRNWKGLNSDKRYPNISGVNSRRELEVQQYIADCKWNPVYAVLKKYTFHGAKAPVPVSSFDVYRMQSERARPVSVYWILQHHAGVSVNQHLRHHPEDEAIILAGVREICEDLRDRDIVHGDIHGDNLCVKQGQDGALCLSLIDFGWCCHSLFKMDEDERQYHYDMLNNDGDWEHFARAHRAFTDET